MWICVDGLLVNMDSYAHFRVKPILGKYAVYGCEHVNGEMVLATFDEESQAKGMIQEMALKIAALKDVECKCHV